MCGLLAISCHPETEVTFSFSAPGRWAEEGPAGYGFAYRHLGRAVVLRSVSSLAEKAVELGRDQSRLRSGMFLFHVRFSPVVPGDGGERHPFLAGHRGIPFAFGHCGNLPGIRLRRPVRAEFPPAPSDSEHAFLWMLERLPSPEDGSFLPVLRGLAMDLKAFGPLDFVLTDGETLWAHADRSLWFTRRTGAWPEAVVRQYGEGCEIRIAAGRGSPGEASLLVASEPFTGEKGWTTLPPGKILAARAGALC